MFQALRDDFKLFKSSFSILINPFLLIAVFGIVSPENYMDNRVLKEDY